VASVLLINPGDEIPNQVVCLDSPINIVFSGFDDDDGEGSEGFLTEDLQGSLSIFAPPLNALQSKFYDASSRVSQTMLSLLVGKSNGFFRDDYGMPLSPRSRRLCFYMADNSFTIYRRYGDWPHSGYASAASCFEITFVAPPEFLGVFIGNVPKVAWPHADLTFEFNLAARNDSTWPTLAVGAGRTVVISFIAADNNLVDVISFLLREDPGLPSPNATVLPVTCIPRVGSDPRLPGGFGVSPCSLAAASVQWAASLDQLPSSAAHGNFSVPLCFVARDSSTSCAGTSESATAAGWYSAPSCALLRVVVPVLLWSSPFMRAHPPYPVVSVGFDCSFPISATLFNAASVPTDVPVDIAVTGNASQLLVRGLQVTAKVAQGQEYWDVLATFRVSAAHQGLNFIVCFEAAGAGLRLTLQRVCAAISVRVCSVCTGPGSSLYAMAVMYYSSTNWQPLIELNPSCSAERLCIVNSSALPISSDLTISSSSGGFVVPGLSIGTAVSAQAEQTPVELARSWNTSESLVRRLNPSRIAGMHGEWCVAQNVREEA
jgi:hypothetical protein